jgi:uncharacterized membrane protein
MANYKVSSSKKDQKTNIYTQTKTKQDNVYYLDSNHSACAIMPNMMMIITMIIVIIKLFIYLHAFSTVQRSIIVIIILIVITILIIIITTIINYKIFEIGRNKNLILPEFILKNVILIFTLSECYATITRSLALEVSAKGK